MTFSSGNPQRKIKEILIFRPTLEESWEADARRINMPINCSDVQHVCPAPGCSDAIDGQSVVEGPHRQ